MWSIPICEINRKRSVIWVSHTMPRGNIQNQLLYHAIYGWFKPRNFITHSWMQVVNKILHIFMYSSSRLCKELLWYHLNDDVLNIISSLLCLLEYTHWVTQIVDRWSTRIPRPDRKNSNALETLTFDLLTWKWYEYNPCTRQQATERIRHVGRMNGKTVGQTDGRSETKYAPQLRCARDMLNI